MMQFPNDQVLKALIIGQNDIAVFGLTPLERLRRTLKRLGIAETADPQEASLILSGECVYGTSVIKALLDTSEETLLLDDDGYVAAAKKVNSEGISSLTQLIERAAPPDREGAKTGVELAGRYDQVLRKRSDPMVKRCLDVPEIEKALFAASYKGVTDFITKHVWPAPALIATRFCAEKKITPNQVTWASIVLVFVTFALFWAGHFGLGLVTAWLMTFLDTVDGKLARVTLTSSRFGDWLDHGTDLVHPPFWWWAWAVGCAAAGTPLADGGVALTAILLGYVLQRVTEGIFIRAFGMQMHIWRKFDSLFRQITARRNPNLFILTIATIAGFPREGLIAVAIWTTISLVVHIIQVILASVAARNGSLTSWLAGE